MNAGQQMHVMQTSDGSMRVRQAPWRKRDDGSGSQMVLPEPPKIPEITGAPYTCMDDGIWLTIKRDGDAECVEIPASGDYVITAQDGVVTAEAILDCDEPTNEVPTTSAFLTMGA